MHLQSAYHGKILISLRISGKTVITKAKPNTIVVSLGLVLFFFLYSHVVGLVLFFFFYSQTCSQLPWCRQMQACYACTNSCLDGEAAVCYRFELTGVQLTCEMSRKSLHSLCALRN